MNKTSTILLTLLVTAFGAAPAVAFHDDGTPLLASNDIVGTGWARYDFTSDGAKVVVDLMADLSSSPAAAAVLVSSSTGGAFMFTLVAGDGGPAVHVTSDALPQGVQVHPTSSAASGRMGVGLTLTGWSGTFSAVAWGAGGVSGVHVALRGDPGIALTGASSGTRTFMGSEGDFHGTINAQVTTGYAKPGVISGDLTKSVGGTLVGQYFAIGETNLVGVTTQQTSVTTSAGTTTCGCFWMDPNAAATPGDYTFHLTYVGGSFISNVFLTGADLSG